MYYLVYKLNISPTMWVIKYNSNIDILLENHDYIYENDIEKYFIFKKIFNFKNHKLKKFEIFNPTMNYKLLYELI